MDFSFLTGLAWDQERRHHIMSLETYELMLKQFATPQSSETVVNLTGKDWPMVMDVADVKAKADDYKNSAIARFTANTDAITPEEQARFPLVMA